jgi:chemotaxis signal transduction protein
VQEIRGYEAPTTIANAPPFLKGVINLRGTIVPIVDLRIKFNVGSAEYTPFTVVIILNLGARVVGIVVDSVSDVTMLRQDQHPPGARVLGERRHPLHQGPVHPRRTHADRGRHRTPDALVRDGAGR